MAGRRRVCQATPKSPEDQEGAHSSPAPLATRPLLEIAAEAAENMTVCGQLQRVLQDKVQQMEGGLLRWAQRLKDLVQAQNALPTGT